MVPRTKQSKLKIVCRSNMNKIESAELPPSIQKKVIDVFRDNSHRASDDRLMQIKNRLTLGEQATLDRSLRWEE